MILLKLMRMVMTMTKTYVIKTWSLMRILRKSWMTARTVKEVSEERRVSFSIFSPAQF